MKIKEVSEFLKRNKIPDYRLGQIIKAVYQDGVFDFSEITTISKELREKMSREIKILSFEVEDVLESRDKKSFKALLKLADGNQIETVLLSAVKNYWSACVSSQAGCALSCKFCATGALGFKRNLTSEEITDQVLFWKQYIKKNNLAGSFQSIVFMGMGEPFMNYEEVSKSIKKLIDSGLFNFGSRHISVSTAGIPEGIKRFAKDFPQVNLAISLTAADDEKRSKIMPINKKYKLSDIRNALDCYFEKNNRKVFLEYIMLEDVNDKRKDADNLIEFINSNLKPKLLHVNLIRYNAVAGELKPSMNATVDWFKEYLAKNKIGATVRKSLGQEIKAACGQLAGK